MILKEVQIKKARRYAFLLLKFRQRSEKEIIQRLRQKKFPREIIKATLFYLKEKRLIDDISFARSLIELGLRKHLSIQRIRQGLQLKGLPEKVVEGELARVKADYSSSSAIQELAKERLEKINEKDPLKVKRQLYAYLLRRGFAAEEVQEVIEEIL